MKNKVRAPAETGGSLGEDYFGESKTETGLEVGKTWSLQFRCVFPDAGFELTNLSVSGCDIHPFARPRSIFCEPTETNRADWNRSVFRDGNRMKNRWRFDCRALTPPPGTGDGERKRKERNWLPNYGGPLRASVPVIDRD